MIIRPAREEDWPRIGELGEVLVGTHHAYDAARFVSTGALPGGVYSSRVRDAIAGGKGTVLVAEVDASIAGYVFAAIEPESWKELRHDAGYVHDLVVDAAHRRGGTGAALLAAAIEWFRARGVTRILLWTAPQNAAGQALFRRFGFRTTMMEMLLEST